MTGRRTSVVATVVAALVAGGVALAAPATVSPGKATASQTAITRCDSTPSGWALTLIEDTNATPNVTALAVSGISGCDGRTLFVGLRNGATMKFTGSATVASGAASVTVTPVVPYNQITNEDFVIFGP